MSNDFEKKIVLHTNLHYLSDDSHNVEARTLWSLRVLQQHFAKPLDLVGWLLLCGFKYDCHNQKMFLLSSGVF